MPSGNLGTTHWPELPTARGREEGNEYEFRYYYDENGKCIETKSNSEDTDDGFYDKRAAKDFQAIFKTMLSDGED